MTYPAICKKWEYRKYILQIIYFATGLLELFYWTFYIIAKVFLIGLSRSLGEISIIKNMYSLLLHYGTFYS